MLPDNMLSVSKPNPDVRPATVPENVNTFDPTSDPTIVKSVSPLFAAMSALENLKRVPPSVTVTALVLAPPHCVVPEKMLGIGFPKI